MSDSPPPSTGLPGLDAILHGLRLGDNVVFQMDSSDDFLPFVRPFVARGVAEQRTLVYFRFARQHDALCEGDGVELYVVDPEIGFEQFLIGILDVIEEKGKEAYYVFDCLSDLAVDWYSDTMLANFFMIACPFLARLDTIAYFALLRDRHLARAVESIIATAQVNLNVFRLDEQLYVQPLKVDLRYSPTMYALHQWEGDAFLPVTDSAVLTEIMGRMPQRWLDFTAQPVGVWARTFLHARETLDAVKAGRLTFREADDCFHRLVRMALTRDPRYIRLAEKYFDLEDVVDILKRMIGPGRIGGKALGMLLARAILRKAGWGKRLETHDSFYIGSDVFYTYLVQNGCWWLRRRQRHPDRFLDQVDEAREQMLSGRFPEHIRQQFAQMLKYFGQSPLIVRSSSLLEDNYGNAFSGKYESVFCPNQGSPDERLQALMDAVRQVYASAMSREALIYRHHRGLLDLDEQMALLVQRVSGGVYGDHFFPQVGGVGFSYNPYVWDKTIDPEAGVARIVLGLGTRAVDRLDDDYTRVIALNAPERRLERSLSDIRRYSQRYMDVLDLKTNRHRTCPVADMLAGAERFPREWFITRDEEAAAQARQHGMPEHDADNVTFDKLIRDTDFVPAIREMLRILHQAYDYPVDVEFTLNFVKDGSYRINVVQCRPFQVRGKRPNRESALPTEVPADRLLLETSGPIIGHSSSLTIDRLIYVVPATFSRLPAGDRYALARVIGQLTHAEPDSVMMLVGPGRWGTSSPAFGVPVAFPEIKNASVICEMAVMHEGLVPDISLGTHFFNDLVELGMLYLGVFPEKAGYTLNESLLLAIPNRLLDFVPGAEEWIDVLHVIDARDFADGDLLRLEADCIEQRAVCYRGPAEA